MNKGFTSLLIILLVVPALAIAGYFYYQTTGKLPEEVYLDPINQYEVAKENMSEIDEKINGFTASFEIYTLGTKRIFTSLMYHNLSSDVYISEPDPSIVHVKKSGVTWDDFFKTLPFSLSKDCLVTGTGQKFCNDENNTLKFSINGQEDQDALDREIKESDIFKVEVITV